MRRLLAIVLLLPALAAAQPPAAAPAAGADSASPGVARDSSRRGARPDRAAPRRQALTPELERSAFADQRAQPLLLRARAARLAQDSALRAYDAKTYQRLTVGMGFRLIGRDRTLLRQESAAHVRWSRDNGVWVEPTGSRAVMPALKEADVDVDVDDIAPIPYFPGRETLWFPSSDMGMARAEVNERDMLHPLATGAEAYYRYATGDSVSIQLPDGGRIALRELRITPRRPQWRAFVGSFWFDVARGSLVRAGYRMSTEMDIWSVASEENRSKLDEAIERMKSDTSAAARAAVAAARSEMDDDVPALVRAMMHPMRANISAITVEYGLYEGRFWLPKANVAEGEAQAGILRVPVRFEERFRYNAVNGTTPVPKLPTPAELGLAADDTTASTTFTISDNGRRSRDTSVAGRRQFDDSLSRRYVFRADSLRTAAEQAAAKGDTADARRLRARAERNAAAGRQLTRKREECARDSTYFAGTRTRYDGALRIAVRMPCDTRTLATSPDLPASIYEPGDDFFGASERDALLSALDKLGLQAGWAPQRPTLRTGLDLVRFNRVEGLSVAGEASAVLGQGYTARAQLRLGTSDLVPNGELSLLRSSGLRTLRAGAFHRLGVANDDWATPLSFGASLASALYGRDEGFYYRTWGAELAGSRGTFLGGTPIVWRLFGERHRPAERELGRSLTGARFIENIAAARANLLGAGTELARTLGQDPAGWRLYARGRGEGAYVDWSGDAAGRSAGFGRALLDATVSRGLGPVAVSVTGAGGAIAGDAPPQRLFYLGGLGTVRGQFARPDTAGYVGDAMWLTRTELGLNVVSVRPVAFYDMGWAGARGDFASPGRPLSGYGVGVSFLDGLVRADLSRGVWPQQRTRFDLLVEARF